MSRASGPGAGGGAALMSFDVLVTPRGLRRGRGGPLVGTDNTPANIFIRWYDCFDKNIMVFSNMLGNIFIVLKKHTQSYSRTIQFLPGLA